ncbi:MAG: hypothetical protein J1G01_04585 [Clostridiales bacterium]|nr:hypothetical protein [Clostridiales bacterium]
MKITKKLITYTVAQALFCAVAPLVFIFVQYGDTRGGLMYKLPLAMLLFALTVVIIAKNTLLKPRIAKLVANIAQHEGDLKVKSDASEVENIEAVLKHERTIEVVLNAIVPILLLAALLIACKALESAMLELSGAIGFTLVSYVFGTVFGVLAAREVHSKHGGEQAT